MIECVMCKIKLPKFTSVKYWTDLIMYSSLNQVLSWYNYREEAKIKMKCVVTFLKDLTCLIKDKIKST